MYCGCGPQYDYYSSCSLRHNWDSSDTTGCVAEGWPSPEGSIQHVPWGRRWEHHTWPQSWPCNIDVVHRIFSSLTAHLIYVLCCIMFISSVPSCLCVATSSLAALVMLQVNRNIIFNALSICIVYLNVGSIFLGFICHYGIKY